LKKKRYRAPKGWINTNEGQEWLRQKLEKKRQARPAPGPTPEQLTRTKFPFAATINGREAIVWSDWIEYELSDRA
jgi:hypothetical protein